MEYIKYLWRKYILGYRYFISYDMGIEDKSCYVTWKKDRKGNLTVENIN